MKTNVARTLEDSPPITILLGPCRLGPVPHPKLVALPPHEVPGNVLGESFKWLAIYLQLCNERGILQGEHSACDLTKAYSLLKRDRLEHINLALGVPPKVLLYIGPSLTFWSVIFVSKAPWDLIASYMQAQQDLQSTTGFSYIDSWLIHSYQVAKMRHSRCVDAQMLEHAWSTKMKLGVLRPPNLAETPFRLGASRTNHATFLRTWSSLAWFSTLMHVFTMMVYGTDWQKPSKVDLPSKP